MKSCVGGLDRHVHTLPTMNFFYLSPDDRDLLKCLLVKYALLVTLILCFWLILNAWPKAETPAIRVNESHKVPFRLDQGGFEPTVSMAAQEQGRGWVENGPQATKRMDLAGNQVNAVEPKPLLTTNVLKKPRARDHSRAVQPTGWRRTRNGWENTANWQTSLPSLGDIVRQQQERESDWLQQLLAQARRVPPWGFALFQLSAVGVVLLFERHSVRKQQRPVIVSEPSLLNGAELSDGQS